MSTKHIIWLTHDVLLISLLFRFFSSLNHIHVPLFMINNVNVTLLSQLLGLYCLSKLYIRLTHDVFLISLLFRIVSCLHQLHLPLFMINNVNVTLLSQLLGLYCLSKLIWLTHDVFLTLCAHGVLSIPFTVRVAFFSVRNWCGRSSENVL